MSGPLARCRLFAAIPALSLFATGCLSAARNDPERRAAAALGVRLVLADATGFSGGAGRLFLRVLPSGGGEAREVDLDWFLPPATPRLTGPVEVRFQPGRDGLAPGVALFDDLLPGQHALSTFLVSARLERPGGEPQLFSLAGSFPALPPVAVAAGELADLGMLRLAVGLDGRFEYRARDEGAAARLAAVRAGRADLASFRDSLRPLGAAPAAPAFAAPGGKATSPPAAQRRAPRAAIAIGVEAVAEGLLAIEAKRGSGLLRVEVRRVGEFSERSAVEVAWELEKAVSAPALDGGGARRPLRLFASDGPGGNPGETALLLPVAPGEHELATIAFEGSVEVEGKSVPVAARADLSRFATFWVRAGEIVDLGRLALDLMDPQIARALPVPGGDPLGRIGALGRVPEGLAPVARPIEKAGGK
jgi:hypothetical protein